MNQRKLIILIFLIPTAVAVAYIGFILFGGGYGKKPVNIQALNSGNSLFLFAHRGISSEFPENSKGAIEQAKIMGFKGLEIDIRKTSDNEFVLFHDEDCDRLLGISEKIYNLSTSQVKDHPLQLNDTITSHYVLTLKEMLDEYKDDFIIYFDLKLKGFDDADELVRIIRSYGISRSSIIASTSGVIIFYIENKYPEINTSLEGFNSGKEWLYYLFPKNFKPDFLSSFASKVNEDHIAWLQKKDLLSGRIVYGVDSTNYGKVIQLGLKNLIIDYYSGMEVH
jgi:glycerophosphoryl diester phosphodiesterase